MSETTTKCKTNTGKKRLKLTQSCLPKLPKGKPGFSTGNFATLKTIVNLISEMTDEINFSLSDEGVSIFCMDSSHVSFMNCQLTPEYFDNFQCDKSKTFGMSIKALQKIFAHCKSNMDISMSFGEDTILIDLANSMNRKSYEIKQMIIDMESLSIPEMEHSHLIMMKSREFLDISRELVDFGDVCSIDIVNKVLKFKSDGDMGKVTIECEPMDIEIKDEATNFHVSLSPKFLCQMAKASNLNDEIFIGLVEDLPVHMTYLLDNNSKLEYYLAPKIDD